VLLNLANKAGHVVERLPPNQCNLNPTELVRKPGKELHCETQQNIQTSRRVRHCHFCIIANYVSKMASRYRLVIKEEGRMWELDGLTDNVIERLVINKQRRRASVL
jgi:hypothetical protein